VVSIQGTSESLGKAGAVPGLNDSCEHLDRAYALARHADATVFTGLTS